jgi:hypothetical protein
MAVRTSRRRVTKRFYLSLAGFVAICALVLVALFGTERYGKVSRGGLSLEANVNVVLVRDETVYSVTNYAAATFFATEGETITQGTTVAQVYKWGFNSKLLTDLITVQEQIRNVQEKEIWADVVNTGLNEINARINNKIQEIAAVVQGNSTADIVSLERKLKELLGQKKDYLKLNVQTNARLSALYSSEQQAQTALANWREDITAESGGVVSFFLDGFEKQLTPYNLETITKADIENARKGVVSDTGTDSTTTKPLYRLVNNYKWYCIVYKESGEIIEEMRENGMASLTFEGYFDRPYTAKIIDIRAVEGGGTMYVLGMSEDVSPLLSVRTANAKLLLNFEGIKLPSDAIHTQNKQTMLKISRNDLIVYVQVDVLIDNGKECIVKVIGSEVIDENTKIILR